MRKAVKEVLKDFEEKFPASVATPNYWCTWCTQSAYLPKARKALAPLFPGDQGQPGVRDSLNEEVIFGADGWLNFYPEVRSDLFFLLDDGWDVPYGAGQGSSPDRMSVFGTMALNPQRFPSFAGNPAEGLAQLTRRIRDAGWRGSGLWVAIQSQAELGMEAWRGCSRRDEWKRKLEWCAEGGISYLKVDWGQASGDISFRQMLTDLKNEIAPQIVIEHCCCQPPVNGLSSDGTGSGRRLTGPEDAELRAWELQALKASDVWRIYDWIEPLSVPQSIDRIVTDISLIEKSGSRTLVSAEDAVYAGAALGCAFGVMRSSLQTTDSHRWPTFPSRRLREVDRAVRWERLAPAFAPTADDKISWSGEVLFDSWSFGPGEYWYAPICGKEVRQGAPAVVARGMGLPEVRADGERPFVLSARNPNGALSVAALPRIAGERSVTPPADVIIDADLTPETPLGVFGEMKTLSLRASCQRRLFAQDLAGGAVHDITAAAYFTEGKVVLSGNALAAIGKETDSDESLPGTLVWME